MRKPAAVLLILSALASSGCASDTHSLSLKNNSEVALTFCPVATSPPPPHRIVSTTVVDPTMRFKIDTKGFNPVFWEPVSGLGLTVQMALDDTPPAILVRVFQFIVPPGQEGVDPSQQPQVLADYYYEVDPAVDKKKIVVRAGPVAQGIPIEIVEN